MAQMKKGPKVVSLVLIVGALLYGASYAANNGYLGNIFRSSVVPQKANLPNAPAESRSAATTEAALPSTSVARVNAPEVRMQVWAWNAQMGLMYANGGPQTTKGSLMEKHNVNLTLTRQDDVPQMQNSLISFANALANGDSHPTAGVHYVAIMGDGAGAFFAGINPQLAKLGSEYTAEVVGSAGYSRGEDGFWGPAKWKTDPQSARGGLVAGYLRDGDWNIALKWLGDSNIPNNPDEKTWDADALNWVSADTYIDAVQKYIAGYCEDRPVVKKGKKTGESKKVCLDQDNGGYVTWTPGDVMGAKKRGGLVPIVTTRQYRSQMPNTIIGIKKWNRDNAETVAHFLAAVFEGGDQVKLSERALLKGAQISAQVYNEEDAEYWARYYKGVTELDATGVRVQLGGSTVNNLEDNRVLFGLKGGLNLFAATYKTFGDIVVQQYPELVPSYPPVNEILNTAYVQRAAEFITSSGQADVAKFEQGTRVQERVSERSWTINFRSGSAEFTPETLRTLDKLANDLAVAGGLAVELHGHTDSDGEEFQNELLSLKRARAVQEWLTSKDVQTFSKNRFQVYGHGESEPVTTNDSVAGKAQNRRVVIVMGTTR